MKETHVENKDKDKERKQWEKSKKENNLWRENEYI